MARAGIPTIRPLSCLHASVGRISGSAWTCSWHVNLGVALKTWPWCTAVTVLHVDDTLTVSMRKVSTTHDATGIKFIRVHPRSRAIFHFTYNHGIGLIARHTCSCCCTTIWPIGQRVCVEGVPVVTVSNNMWNERGVA
ncbi:unnamed protein product [Ectocarpus sp. 12 AP-2014]